MRRRDALIVGAGPAGSVTALLLARAGWDVLLLDAHDFPRAKPCGDCISPGANRLLRQLGVWKDIENAHPARLKAWRLASPGGAFSAAFADDVSLALPRSQLDTILLNAARAAGAEIRTGVRVRQLLRDSERVVGVLAENVPIEARIIIGADGLRSRTARQLNAYARPPRVRKFSLTAHPSGVRHTRATGEMHVLADACLGIAPVSDDAEPLCNVTVVLRSGTQQGLGAHDLLRSALCRFGRDDIAERISDDDPVLTSGPFDWPVRQVVFEGAALVGDAAGYFDPFTGQGIYSAIAGAHALADALAGALHSTYVSARSLQAYGAAHSRVLRATHRVQHVVDYV
ncbi:MAG TPA: NAD(P)/FAD-dependent oxidoreductase, partial [Longimicrobiales bacterium]